MHADERREPLLYTEFPEGPWMHLATDLLEYNKKMYLVVIDVYSRYIELALIDKITSENIIINLKSIFARHGIPYCLRSDNGPQYKLIEFQKFAKEYGFNHERSSPRYSQSDGEAERAVQTVKNLLKKNSDPYLGLMIYRSTPQSNGFSPDELLFNRRIRTTLPSVQIFKYTEAGHETLKEKERKSREHSKQHYDRIHRARSKSPLETGDNIVLGDSRAKGKVIRKHSTPRSYWIRNDTGSLIRRNRRDLIREPDNQKY